MIIRLDTGDKKYKVSLPATYGDCTRKQAIRIAELFIKHKLPFGGITDEDRIMLLGEFMGLRPDHFYQLGDLAITSLISGSFLRDPENIFDGSPSLKYFSYPGWCGGSSPLSRGVAALRRTGGSLPSPALKHSPFLQFIIAEDYYQNILEGEDFQENLNGLVSILCTPISPLEGGLRGVLGGVLPWGRCRRQRGIDPDLATIRKIQLRSTPTTGRIQAEKIAVLQYYHGTRKLLVESFSPMFKKRDEGSTAVGKGPDFTGKYRWWALLHDLAEKHVFGDFDQTANHNLHDVMHHVCYNADKYHESEVRKMIYG